MALIGNQQLALSSQHSVKAKGKKQKRTAWDEWS